jgi:electron-transferring-flavoprotein dehydrogenase
MPRHLAVPGMCIAGDAAGMVNIPELKGIHYAMHAGMFAAETIVDALKKDSINFDAYEKKVRESVIAKDLYRSRNMRQPFSRGFFVGGVLAFLMTLTKGAFPGGHWSSEADAENKMFLGERNKSYPKPDNKYVFDKLSSVFASGNATRDDAPNHIRLQHTVPREVAQAWAAMCPAQVYELPEDLPEDGEVTVQVTPSNCIQCGAITAKGGRLTPPEGGDGPMYTLA